MDEEILDTETIEEQKKKIEQEQTDSLEAIQEVDEAALSAEGEDNREDDIRKDVVEDRDMTPPTALDIPEIL